jgi:hypothetical protein
MSAPIGKTCGSSDEHAELSSKILFQRFGQRVNELKKSNLWSPAVIKKLLLRGVECAKQEKAQRN